MSNGMVVPATSSHVHAGHINRPLWSLLVLLAITTVGRGSECPRPPSILHSWVNLTETNRGFLPLGTVLQYGCDQGYAVDGLTVISCMSSGRWSSEPPRCVRTDVCWPPFKPKNGGYICHPSPCHRLTQGTVIEYFCNEGYVLKGDYKYLTCQNGEWDSPMQISCRAVTDQECPKPSSVLHSWVNLTETNRGFLPLGTVLQYSCNQGYTVDGPTVISCMSSGRWSSEPPSCVRSDVCRQPFQPENGGYMCHPSPCHRLTLGTVIEYFCDEGYALKGDYKYLTCQNGEWDSPMQISCRLSQGKDVPSPLGMPTLSIVASTASSVALILLLVVLFVLLQPKLKSFHHSRREQGVSGQPVSIVVEGVQVSLPSYEEAVYGSAGTFVPPPESRVQIVLSEGPQAAGAPAQEDEDGATAAAQAECNLPSTSTSSRHSEMVLVHQAPSSSSSSSSSSWSPGQASRPQRQDSDSSDQHSLLSLASVEDCADDIPLLKEA
ncbi:sushi domain-containing protein 6 [Paramormyrops kingsleyae]|uniref:Sushi domain containing 6 n=1 Tax=Paramormyrops kingsleyae TaxID=1676925 RepID=A0A3B3R9J9_9TELE|nr:sushi domain-containing protein 6 isoform X1 [Paramormyrops kingsleyae]XP_023657995.1 sushi domain-containing protein 6 isoform X1 [Paramormyrops kingsleyae]